VKALLRALRGFIEKLAGRNVNIIESVGVIIEVRSITLLLYFITENFAF